MILKWLRMWIMSTAQVSLSVCVCVRAGSGFWDLRQGIAHDSPGQL